MLDIYSRKLKEQTAVHFRTVTQLQHFLLTLRLKSLRVAIRFAAAIRFLEFSWLLGDSTDTSRRMGY